MEGSPINHIISMKQQGLSNNQIIQNLQREGYNNTQIFDALNQAEAKHAVDPISVSPMPTIENSVNHDMQMENYHQGNQAASQLSNINNEEMIEAIIDEKWAELLKDVNKIIDWKNRAESRIAAMEAKVESLEKSFDNLHKGILGKVSEYDKHILDVGTELKAMEKVFSKVLPSFTENVHELSRITQKIRQNGG